MSLYHDVNLLDVGELLTLPPVTYLLDKIIPEEGLVGLYGQPEGGKSFIALDWAVCISQGRPWLGRIPVKQAPVVYIAAEGGRGIQARVRALMNYYGVKDLPGLYFLLNPLYIREEGVIEDFLNELASHDDNPNPHDPNGGIWPGLIVLDTLSRSFGGGEENASADMGAFVDAVTELAAQRRMAALVIHHTNAQGARERGHGSFRGGVDAMFSVDCTRTPDGRMQHIELQNNKQKDDERIPSFWLEPKVIEDPRHKPSIVLTEMASAPIKEKKGQGPPRMMRKVDMVTLLGTHPDGLTREEWRLACGIDKRLFRSRVARLITDGDIYTENGRYYVVPALADLAAAGDEEDS